MIKNLIAVRNDLEENLRVVDEIIDKRVKEMVIAMLNAGVPIRNTDNQKMRLTLKALHESKFTTYSVKGCCEAGPYFEKIKLCITLDDGGKYGPPNYDFYESDPMDQNFLDDYSLFEEFLRICAANEIKGANGSALHTKEA